jgi:hypothetical protein
MANSYIVLDGLRYPVAKTRYEPRMEKLQRVHVTVGGKTVSQTFAFTEYRWGFDIRVDYISDDPLYGTLTDLKAAYAKPYVTFVDHYGTDQGTVFFEGPLGEHPLGAMLDGNEAPFIVPANLRKRQP